MKGVIFTNFRYLVEDQFGDRMMDDILEDCRPESDGAYSTLGDYPHQELLALVAALSRRTGVPQDELIQLFGAFLIGVFLEHFPAFFARASDTFSFLQLVPDVIHLEVKKLYERAEPPRFEWWLESPDHMVLVYSSRRRLGLLARGMILACSEHFGDGVRVEETALPDPDSLRFDLWRAA